jgi:hypothetical protein
LYHNQKKDYFLINKWTNVHLFAIIKTMTETTKEPGFQTMTTVGKVSVTDDSTVILLGLIGYSATKLWNTAVWYTKEIWETTGKIPAYSDLDVAMKQEHPLWYRRLHSQSAQAVLEDLWHSYRSWFALRKKGDKKARPPKLQKEINPVICDIQTIRRSMGPVDFYSTAQHPKRHLRQAIPLPQSKDALWIPSYERQYPNGPSGLPQRRVVCPPRLQYDTPRTERIRGCYGRRPRNEKPCSYRLHRWVDMPMAGR